MKKLHDGAPSLEGANGPGQFGPALVWRLSPTGISDLTPIGWRRLFTPCSNIVPIPSLLMILQIFYKKV
jgi:hypothetical protein